MSKICLRCDEPIVGPWAFRIRIGGVTDCDQYGMCFVQDPQDHFNDNTQTKWLCPVCAQESNVNIDDLELNSCKVVEGNVPCTESFQPVEEINSEQVLLVEYGEFCQGDKGPGEMFMPAYAGHVHFNCACDGWRLPLWSIPPDDTPSDDA